MKPIQRTDSLRNRRRIDDKTVEVYAAEKGGMRKIRCTNCTSGIAVPGHAANGKQVYICGSCGAQFSSRSM